MMCLSPTRRAEQRDERERGAALVEFALAIPIFLILIAFIFDAGLGYAASRSNSAAARSAARVGALAGEDRLADYRILDAIRVQYGDGTAVESIVVYLSEPASDGTVPSSCVSASDPGVCNFYEGSVLNNLQPADFLSVPGSDPLVCDISAIDAAWCPTNRRVNEGKYLGVAIITKQEAAVGLVAEEFEIEDRAVFSMYFPPEPAPVAPPAP